VIDAGDLARGWHGGPGAVVADQTPSLRRVRRREQRRDGHVDEARIAVVALAIREAQLHRLGDQVHVGGGVVTERGEVVGLQQRQRLEQDGALTPRPAAQHVDTAERRTDRGLDLRAVFGEVVRRQQATVLAVVAHHGGREIAPVEGGARGGQAGGTTAAARGSLLVDHELQRAREIRLSEQLAFPRRPPARQPDGGVSGASAGTSLRSSRCSAPSPDAS
jgi:hypothetical protein